MKKFGFPLAIAGIVLMFMNFQCRKDYVPIQPLYTFQEKLSLVPYKKVYAINDTIWIQFQTNDKTLFDTLTNRRISTDTTFLQNTIYYYRRYPDVNTQELFSDAKVENGLDVNFTTLYTYYNVLSFNTGCSNTRYFFKIAFVPKKPGIYSIEPNAMVSRCPNKQVYEYSPFKYVFDLGDCNKDIWLSIPSQSRGGDNGFTDRRIDRKEIFVFKVE